MKPLKVTWRGFPYHDVIATTTVEGRDDGQRPGSEELAGRAIIEMIQRRGGTVFAGETFTVAEVE